MSERFNMEMGAEQESVMAAPELGRDWIERNRVLESVFRSFEENPDLQMEIIRQRSGDVEGGANGLQA